MRTNIVLDDALISQALKLTGAASKKEVINLALQQLVNSCIKKKQNKQDFIESYINNPIRMEDFTPLHRDDIYNLLSICNPLV